MKTYSVEYREAYSRSYTVKAESPEEAEEKILNGIGEGSYPPPEECVGSWCTTQNFEEESADFLKKLTNNEKRKEWIQNYKNWRIWFAVPEADEVYYRFDFPDGYSFVICEYKVYLEWMEKYNHENPDRIRIRFYLMKPNSHYLNDCCSNEPEFVELLKELKKKQK